MEHLKRHLSAALITHVRLEQSAPSPASALDRLTGSHALLLGLSIGRICRAIRPGRDLLVLPTIRKLLIWVTINWLSSTINIASNVLITTKGTAATEQLSS